MNEEDAAYSLVIVFAVENVYDSPLRLHLLHLGWNKSFELLLERPGGAVLLVVVTPARLQLPVKQRKREAPQQTTNTQAGEAGRRQFLFGEIVALGITRALRARCRMGPQEVDRAAQG